MHRHHLTPLTLLAGLFALMAPLMVLGDDDRPIAPTTAPATAPARTGQSLEHDMGAMGKAMKTLKGQIKDEAQNQSSLTTVVALEQATLAAKGEVPPMLAKLPDDQRRKQIADYRTMMTNLLQQELELEQDLLADENTKAAATYDDIVQTESQGHKEYRPKRGGSATTTP